MVQNRNTDKLRYYVTEIPISTEKIVYLIYIYVGQIHLFNTKLMQNTLMII